MLLRLLLVLGILLVGQLWWLTIRLSRPTILNRMPKLVTITTMSLGRLSISIVIIPSILPIVVVVALSVVVVIITVVIVLAIVPIIVVASLIVPIVIVTGLLLLV